MKGIYLAAFTANHKNYSDIVYQDINGERDIGGDMMNIDLSPYDFIIATPPCNFWSFARGNRCSQYSLDTKHLLPDIIDKLVSLNKPFIVENVKNPKRFKENGILPRYDCYVIIIGRHIYFTNVCFPTYGIKQRQDFTFGGYTIKYEDMDNCDVQGGYNVYQVIEKFLETIHDPNYKFNPPRKLKQGTLFDD